MKNFLTVFLMVVSLNVHSKQVEKISFKQIRDWTLNQDIVFVCKIEASTGYSYQDGKWQVTQFETGEKFLLRELTKDDPGFNNKNQAPFGVFDVGEKAPQMFCTVDEEAGSVSCKGVGELSFSIETTQFLRVNSAGSVYPDDVTNKNYPKMMHGSCLLKSDERM